MPVPAGHGNVRFIWLRPPSLMGNECQRRARAMDPAVQSAMEGLKDDLIAYMRDNAPWTDRTGDARRGLSANVGLSGNSTTLSAFHTVPYGGYLETGTSRMSAYPILRPALEAHYGKVRSIMGEIAGSG